MTLNEKQGKVKIKENLKKNTAEAV